MKSERLSGHKEIIPRPFDVQELGASFREVASDVVRGANTDFINRWFRAKSTDADLMIWFDGENRLIKHQLCFFGQVVEWNPIHGTRTGLIVEEESGSPDVEAAESIRFDSKAQESSIHQAIGVLNHVPGISETERAALIYNLRQSPKLHKNARERALKTWAAEGESIVKDNHPGFWKKLKSWVSGSF